MTLASLEIVECLIDSNNSGANTTPLTEFVELLVFPKESSSNTGFTNKTDFKMKFKYVEDVENAGYAQLVKCTDPYTTVE